MGDTVSASDWGDFAAAPRDGTYIDAWAGGCRLCDVYWCDEGDGWAKDGSLILFPHRLTHWRLAPGPPNGHGHR
jgi:hypothetical protein